MNKNIRPVNDKLERHGLWEIYLDDEDRKAHV